MQWPVSEAEHHGQLLELQAKGFSLSEIAEVIGCGKSTVKAPVGQA